MYHNLINNIHVPFVYIVNRIKIEIRRMVEKKNQENLSETIFGKTFWIILNSISIFTPDTSQIYFSRLPFKMKLEINE